MRVGRIALCNEESVGGGRSPAQAGPCHLAPAPGLGSLAPQVLGAAHSKALLQVKSLLQTSNPSILCATPDSFARPLTRAEAAIFPHVTPPSQSGQ